MTKLILTIIYPLWYFLAKTLVGGILMLVLSVCTLPLIIHLIWPSLGDITGEEAEALGQGLGFLSILAAPFCGMFYMSLSLSLEIEYEKLGYKVTGLDGI